MNLENTAIAILSNQKVRANSIQNLIRERLGELAPVSVFQSIDLSELKRDYHKLIIFVDLMSSDRSARVLLTELREMYPHAKIIAMHIYRSFMLVKPLFDTGINGYIYYEPSKDELLSAIASAANNEDYKPDYLVNP